MIYIFGDYTLDIKRCELRHLTNLVPLRLKAFGLLQCLVINRERVVTKDELLLNVWEGRVISQTTLDSCIMEARQAIGDNGRTQRMIRTIRGRGYRFVARVEVTDSIALPNCSLEESTQYQHQPSLTTSIMTPQRESLDDAGEYKFITALVCHFAGVWSVVENDAEMIYGLRQTILNVVVDVAKRYEGTLQYIEDGTLLVLFGIPWALEDHALRAVKAAQEMGEALWQPITLANSPSGKASTVRFGLHTGQVIVGALTHDYHVSVTPVGNTLSFAKHLATIAPPRQIWLSSTTWFKLQDKLRVEPAASFHCKSQPSTVAAYRLLSIDSLDGLSPMSAKHSWGRFVGRNRELALLETLYTQATTGQGQVVGMVGAPGIGKTRLLTEFYRRCLSDRVIYVEGRCQSYGQHMPYLPLRMLLRQLLGLGGEQNAATIAAQIQVTLHALDLSVEHDTPYLLYLLGYDHATDSLALLTAEALRTRLFAILREICLRRSQQRPLVLAVENLHWIDQSSEAYLSSLVQVLGGSALLLLTTFRPGYQPPWMAMSYSTQIALPRLSRADSFVVVQNILPDIHPETPMVQHLLGKAEGNPLFLEELTRSVQEHNGHQDDLTIPDTIHDVLMARIDRLPEPTKRVLQTAAVLGREISLRLLEAVWESPDDLECHLQDLQRFEFLNIVWKDHAHVYTFKHALIQEVAYNSILRTRRQALHASAGRALEVMYAEQLEVVYDLLAYHYTRTHNAIKAITYLTHMAEQAAQSYAHTEAVAILHDALQHADRLPGHTSDTYYVDLLLRQINSLRSLGHLRAVLERLLQHQERLECLHEPRLSGPYYVYMSSAYSSLGEHTLAMEYARRALTAAEQCHDNATMGKAYYVLSYDMIWQGNYRQGIEYGQKAAAILKQTTEYQWLGRSYLAQGSSCVYLGELEMALEASAQAQVIGEMTQDLELLSRAANVEARVRGRQGDWHNYLKAARQSLSLAPDPYFKGVSFSQLGEAHLGLGNADQAVEALENAVQYMSQFGQRSLQGVYTAHLGAAYLLHIRTELRLQPQF